MYDFCSFFEDVMQRRDFIMRLYDKGVFLLPLRGSEPACQNWRDMRRSAEVDEFSVLHGVAARIGPESGFVEVDVAGSSQAASIFMPPPFMSYGPAPSRASRCLYKVINPGRTVLLRAEDQIRIEVRSELGFALLPYSPTECEDRVYLSSGPYNEDVSGLGYKGPMEYRDVVQAACELAIAMRVQPFWHTSTRLQLAQLLADFFTFSLQFNWSLEKTRRFIGKMVKAFDPKKDAKPIRLRRGLADLRETVYRLDEMIGVEALSDIAEWAEQSGDMDELACESIEDEPDLAA